MHMQMVRSWLNVNWDCPLSFLQTAFRKKGWKTNTKISMNELLYQKLLTTKAWRQVERRSSMVARAKSMIFSINLPILF